MGPTLIKMRPPILFRRVLECFASGVLTMGGELSGLSDPALLERPFARTETLPDPGPLFTCLDGETATFAAQLALRMVAFKQMYKVSV